MDFSFRATVKGAFPKCQMITTREQSAFLFQRLSIGPHPQLFNAVATQLTLSPRLRRQLLKAFTIDGEQ